jgi:hypothetical protein
MATQIHSIPQRLTLRHAIRETLTLTKVLAKGMEGAQHYSRVLAPRALGTCIRKDLQCA